MNPPPKRRKHQRRVAYIIAEYTVNEGTYRDVIKNIGGGGLFIWTQRIISVGQSIVLNFPLFDFENIIQVSGTVIRRDNNGFAVVLNEPIDGLISEEDNLPEIVHEGNRSS